MLQAKRYKSLGMNLRASIKPYCKQSNEILKLMTARLQA